MEAGFPAWAGIDRKLDIYFLFLPRLPRVGGDRPNMEAMRTRIEKAPPRGRG